MREIKFRGQTPEGEWVYGDLINTVTVTNGIEKRHKQIGTDFDFEEVRPETIAQFTGLIDKNGKEIYEGDLISAKSYNLHCLNSHLFRVTYDLENAAFILLDLDTKRIEKFAEFYDLHGPFKPGETVYDRICCCLNWHKNDEKGNCSYCSRPRIKTKK